MNPQRTTLILGIANLTARLTGLAREVVFSAIFGAGLVTDAFNAAFRVPQLLRELLAEGSLQNALVPSFTQTAERDGEQEAWKLAQAALGVLLLVLGVTTLLFVVGAPWWVRLIANDFSGNAEKFDLTITLTRILAPFLAGLSLAGFLGGLLNARGQFFWPAITQNVLNLLVLVACFLAQPFGNATGQPPILLVALATTLSGFVQVVILLPSVRREGFSLIPTLARHPALPRMIRTFGPALLGISTVQVNLLIESQWASSYGDGPLSWLNLSFRLVQIPLAVFAGSVATASLAGLSLFEARNDKEGFTRSLTEALSLNSFLVLPCAVAFVVLAEPLTRFCFERGAFTPEATAGTAAMLQMYGLAAWGICFHRIAVPVFYTLNQPGLPARLSLLAMLAKVPVILLLTRGMGMGVAALPLSHAITVGGESLLLAWGLKHRLQAGILAKNHLKILLACLGLGGVLYGLSPYLHVALTCAVGGLAYLGVAWAMGMQEVRWLLPKPKGLPPFVDPASAAGLKALAAGGLVIEGNTIHCASGIWEIRAQKGSVVLEPAHGQGEAGSEAGPVAIIVRIGQGPPSMRGIAIGNHIWHADGDTLIKGPVAGPRIPVSAAR